MTQNRRALIAGASIAGPALAYWLHRYGWDTVIVERAPELRTGGQNVDVRGAGRAVSRRMGLEEQIRAATTGEQGTRFVNAQGQTEAAFPVRHTQTSGATAELEILRGDLARLLHDATAQTTEYRFGDRITGLKEQEQGVQVSFEHGQDEHFDLVVAADGLRSGTRFLMLGDEPEVRSLGLTIAYLTLPRTATDDDWWRWYNAPGRRSITLRPDNVGTIRATVGFISDRSQNERLSQDDQKTLIRRVFGGAGWEANRILAALDDTDDWYFDAVAQVRAPRWSNGRMVLLGDAAYCASPISGMGTSLALVGAYVLAGELAAHVDARDGLKGYERIMRPYVEQAQALPPGTPKLAYPASPLGIRVFHGFVKLAAAPVIGRLGNRFFTPPADKIDLPDYRHLEQRV